MKTLLDFFTLERLGWNDKTRSVKVNQGCQLTGFAAWDFSGRSCTYNAGSSNNECLGVNSNGISSFKCKCGGKLAIQGISSQIPSTKS